ncbi:MAG: hypothetical protein NT094_02705 [Candidatus Staskawiczbacteria bacterium]|nr:hypothetical protein [Candidatus Staskawiczbacteria bacterium]
MRGFTRLLTNSRKFILYLGIILIIALVVLAGLFFYYSKINPTKKTGSSSTPITIPEDVLKNYTVPSGNEKQIKIPEDVLKNYTVPK